MRKEKGTAGIVYKKLCGKYIVRHGDAVNGRLARARAIGGKREKNEEATYFFKEKRGGTIHHH
jgi:hypothetical protein